MTLEVEPCTNKDDGELSISGGKNSILPLVFATLLIPGSTVFHKAPCGILDLRVALNLLRSLGMRCTTEGTSIRIDNSGPSEIPLDPGSCGAIRYSILLAAVMLRLFGRVRLPMIGGCSLGERPIDIHLAGLTALGARFEWDGDYLIGELCSEPAGYFALRYPSVTATQTLILFSVLSAETVVLANCAREPEVDELISFLRRCGASIEDGPPGTLRVDGRSRLSAGEWVVSPDRIEFGSFATLATITRRRLALRGALSLNDHFATFLRSIGVDISFDSTYIIVDGRATTYPLRRFEVETGPYPGFATDLQPVASVLSLRTEGPCRLTERVFPTRFAHLREMAKLGVCSSMEGNTAIIQSSIGRRIQTSAKCLDIRSAMALLLTCLISDGPTTLSSGCQLLRGYHDIIPKLRSIGIAVTGGYADAD